MSLGVSIMLRAAMITDNLQIPTDNRFDIVKNGVYSGNPRPSDFRTKREYATDYSTGSRQK